MSRSSESTVERRATSARLSLCLLAAIAALAVPAVAASYAQAEQLETILLSKSSPQSTAAEPANSTTPLVFGGEEGVIISVVRFGTFNRVPIASGNKNPSNEVTIYANPSCTGPAVGAGTLEELMDTGIQVAVAENAKSTLYATQADPNGIDTTSNCPSISFDYWEGSPPTTPVEPPPSVRQPPPAEQRPATGNAPLAPRLHVSPAGRANDNSPKISGAAPGADRVKIFTNSSCSGTPVANVSAGELGAGINFHVADNSVTDFAGTSIAGGKQSFCSPPATYIEDSNPPRVRITMGPGTKTRRHKAVFRFTDASEEPEGTTFSCRVNHRKWKPCHSPFKLRHLGFRRYVLRVRGIDAIGNAEVKPAKRGFKVIH